MVVGGAQLLFFSARLCLLTLLSYCCALAVNSMVAMWLTSPPAVILFNDSASGRVAQPKPPLSSYAVVYTRDIFNAIKAPTQVERTPLAAGSGSPLKLWGTAIGDNERTFAIIEDVGTHTQGLYHAGDQVLPGVTLMEVRWDRVVIDRSGRRETLLLPTTPSVTLPIQTAAVAAPNGEQDGVRQVTQDSFQIDRREVDHAMSNLNELFTQARAVPYTSSEGEAQGFRLFSIKPQSLIDRIGLKNGDIVQRVNGVEISDPSTAFSLLQTLQGQTQVRVDVLRNHQPVTLSYEIQ
ncbi:MAG TPA: type II secretion system protein GspC [Methylomirabilota bacterium]|nr:type II secretion system protein GspC [Methylomirabilota bacterium]